MSLLQFLYPYIPYDYWDLEALSVESTILSERLHSKNYELDELGGLMMQKGDKDSITAYNYKKNEYRAVEGALNVVNRIIRNSGYNREDSFLDFED